MALKDLFKPAWKNSNPSVRLEAIKSLPDEEAEIFIDVAISDPDKEIRLLAANRLNQEQHLALVAAGDPGDEVLERVNRRLNSLWREMIVQSPNAGECQPLLERISDEGVLAQIASTAEAPEVRLAAIRLIRSQRLLCQVAESPCGKEPGAAAVDKITEKELLERLARKGANKAVRKLAETRLAKIESLAQQPTPEDLNRLQLDELAQEARKLGDSWNWGYARERFLEIKQEWKRLDPNFQHGSHSDVEAARVNLEERYEGFQERQAKEREIAEARQGILEQQEALLDQLEDILEDASDEAASKREALVVAWEALPELPGDLPSPHAPDFKAYLEQHQEACRVARDDTTGTNRLEELAKEAEAIADGDPNNAKAEQAFKALADEAKGIKLQNGNPGPWRSRIQDARTKFQERREAYLKAAREAHQQQQSSLESICDQLDALMKLANWRDAVEAQKDIKQVWREAARDQINPKSLEEVTSRYEAINLQFGKWLRQKREEEHWERWANSNVKEILIQRINALDDEQDAMKIASAIKEAQAEWKDSGPTPRKEAEELWKRFREACDRQYVKVKAYYEQRDAEREENLKKKREIADQAAALRDSTDWEATAEALRGLQAQWEKIGPAPRNEEQRAYDRFRGAGDAFFDRLEKRNAEEAAIRQENQEEKEHLCVQAESLADSTDWWDTFADIKRLQEQWKTLGPAPKEAESALWERFQKATQTFFTRLDAVRPDHLAAKEAIVKEAQEVIAGATGEEDAKEDADKLKELQARWKEIGPAPQDEERALWKTFRDVCNSFFEARRERFQELLQGAEEKMELKQELIRQAEAHSTSRKWAETGEKLKALQARWKEIGSIPFREDRELYQKFRAACNTFFEARDEHIARRNDERYQNLHHKEEICARLEIINGDTDKTGSSDKTLSIADQLKLAFEENFVLGGNAEGDRKNAAHQEVKKLQAEWRDLGPVPRKYDQQLYNRYRAALDKFYGK